MSTIFSTLNIYRAQGGHTMTLKKLSLDLELGQEILVGKNNERAKITKIEYHEKTGVVSLNTTRGPRSALTFKLCPTKESSSSTADKYR